MAGVALAAMAISSCDDNTMTIGNSLTNENDRLDIEAGVFHATSKTYAPASVLSLSSNCYLGKVKDPETQADVTSEFSTQFHLMESFYISPEDSLLSRTNDNKAGADSCELILYLSSPFKRIDTLASMKLRVLEMDTPVQQGKNYYTDYDPRELGLIRKDGISREKMFTYRNLTDSENDRSSTGYINNVHITLNKPYTDKNGTTYNNYGTYILQQYYRHPEYFRNNYTFSHNVCPGFFFEITDGLGFYSQINNIGLCIYYKVKNDSTYDAALIVAGTKEVAQTTKITNDQQAIAKLAAETKYTYLKTPAGLFTEVTLPVEDIKKGHENDSLMAASISFQRINNESTDERMLGTTSTIMMIEKDSLTHFFESLKVTDNKTSFLSNYNAQNNVYAFSNVSSLITAMWNQKKRGEKEDSEWLAKHPNWNKVLLVPVTYTTSSSSTTPTRIEHNMALTSTRLEGGATPIDVKVVYAKFH